MGKTSGINCSVTVMPVLATEKGYRIGFIRRPKNDSYLPGTLVAAGGKLEGRDGTPVHDVMYFSAEECAVRELAEECGLHIPKSRLKYFCSLTLPNGRIVMSFYCLFGKKPRAKKLIYLTEKETRSRKDFAPGMDFEALKLFGKLKSEK